MYSHYEQPKLNGIKREKKREDIPSPSRKQEKETRRSMRLLSHMEEIKEKKQENVQPLSSKQEPYSQPPLLKSQIGSKKIYANMGSSNMSHLDLGWGWRASMAETVPPAISKEEKGRVCFSMPKKVNACLRCRT